MHPQRTQCCEEFVVSAANTGTQSAPRFTVAKYPVPKNFRMYCGQPAQFLCAEFRVGGQSTSFIEDSKANPKFLFLCSQPWDRHSPGWHCCRKGLEWFWPGMRHKGSPVPGASTRRCWAERVPNSPLHRGMDWQSSIPTMNLGFSTGGKHTQSSP